jgi:ADP-heptose:LPS heptosyltransferase
VEILVLHPGALGDIILALPAISLLRQAYPSSRITFAGNIDHLDFILKGRVDAVLSLSTLPLHRLYTSEAPAEADIQFWKSYHHIISWTGSADVHFCRNMKAIHPDARIASWKPAAEDTRHVSQIFADSLGIEVPDTNVLPVNLEPDAATRDQGRQWLLKNGWNGADPLTAIHPGAGGSYKRWPLLRYIELVRYLVVHDNRRVIIIEGPAEQGMTRQILQAVPHVNLIPCEGAGIPLVAGILAHCQNFIGNDSGITHLAAAMGVPCLALFGPTLPKHWAPQGGGVIAMRNTRACRGCEAGESSHTCLENISMDMVARQFQRLLAISVCR